MKARNIGVGLAALGVASGMTAMVMGEQRLGSHPAPIEALAPSSTPLTPVTNYERRVVQQVFAEDKRIWAKRRIANAAVNLVIIPAGKEEACAGSGMPISKGSNAFTTQYCTSSESILLTQALINDARRTSAARGVSERGALRFMVNHEDGHGVQDAANLSGKIKTIGDEIKYELQADCYSGQLTAEQDPLDVVSAEAYIATFAILDPTHGLVGQRLQSFDRGAHGEDC